MQNAYSSSVISVNPGLHTSGDAYLRAHALSVSEVMAVKEGHSEMTVGKSLRNPMRALFELALRIGMSFRS